MNTYDIIDDIIDVIIQNCPQHIKCDLKHIRCNQFNDPFNVQIWISHNDAFLCEIWFCNEFIWCNRMTLGDDFSVSYSDLDVQSLFDKICGNIMI